jgi:hypothetical protein
VRASVREWVRAGINIRTVKNSVQLGPVDLSPGGESVQKHPARVPLIPDLASDVVQPDVKLIPPVFKRVSAPAHDVVLFQDKHSSADTSESRRACQPAYPRSNHDGVEGPNLDLVQSFRRDTACTSVTRSRRRRESLY